ncbi:uncharacterized protein LOC116116848 [Pistacia vera]|uniref:uncharacterized protein LOC116116848 n=1 Tax=Pistacia vera TaxID=55513 RepID=UPI001262FBA0|nr:uncharacterized protein LOC116116848 [Pistacia vera]
MMKQLTIALELEKSDKAPTRQHLLLKLMKTVPSATAISNLELVTLDMLTQNPSVHQFLHKGLVDRELYKVIFQKQNATGRFAFTSASEPTASTLCFFDPIEADMNQDDFDPDLDRSTGEKRSNRSGDSRSVNRRRRRRRRDGEGNPFLGVMTQLAEAISNKTMGSEASIRSGGDRTQENTSARTDRYSMENCQAILESMQLPPQVYLDAMKYLIANPEWLCDAILELRSVFIKPPDFTDVPLEISTNPNFYPFFKDCLGAIDGTHIRRSMPVEVADMYRNRKGALS